MRTRSAVPVSLPPVVSVGLGGALGAALRWLVSTSMGADNGLWSIFVINIAGSFLLGLLVAHRERSGGDLFLLLGVGFTGGLTTFSTFALDVALQLDDGAITAAVLNTVGTVFGALLAAGIGYRAGRASR